ncbi:TPR-like protein [Metschnikowia bicuspidata var. bicuspidata NRRL YB-4993]|uniref:TPR-like protein n=1 Tax=Metschnikowia bicuspidata var. bicuspidata NRRL YB-4993 TaxID=869754 RepID=A0A1A0HIB7_9ASCO|nr:TPR-like protein [Metschnikowia bicuspidata var. bicuspidata NRRL YB-4993]OBA23583.1 TPR-like protein [Metschnikowia bicuspidata var. bicuspidata NRRL YB-4993]
MDTDPSYIVQHLRSIVIHSLDSFNLKNAEFAAERLVAIAPDDPNSIYLYALTLYRQGKYKTAFNRSNEGLQHGINHLGCAYIFARLCLHLQKYKEGIYRLVNVAHLYNESAHKFDESDTVLEEHSFTKLSSYKGHQGGLPTISSSLLSPGFHLPSVRHNYEFSRSIYPESSAIYHLLGDLYKALGDSKNSILNYQQALRFNAFDFEAFQELSKLGAELSVKSLYKFPSHIKHGAQDNVPKYSASNSSFFPRNGYSDTKYSEKPDGSGVPNPFSTTPRQNNTVLEISTPQINTTTIPDAPMRRTHGQEEHTQTGLLVPVSKLGERKTPTAANKPFPYMKRKPELTVSEGARGSKRSASLGLLAPSNSYRTAPLKDVEVADAYLRQLYCIFAKLFKSFLKYDCYKAIRVLETLPENEQNTPWVLSMLGRLHYEIVNYKQSKKYFVALRQQDRTRLEDMEYYSTLLWHLHKKVELTYLANELHDIDENLAITWCVMGNLFSLTREADEAIRCFNKSLAIDPKFTYAYTLRGHEYFSNDNYEKALECFRYSILLDARHYNAFYGIGMVYINLGEYQKADYHFKKAVAINPINIILICCVGMVLEKLGKKTLALRQYELANKLQPLSALPIFKKAQLLFAMQQFPQALEQFEIVKELAPNEASVHFLLGQLYNLQKDKFLAIREFTIALNLDPKGNYLIREAMETLKD